MTMEGDSHQPASERLLHSIREKSRQLKRLLSGEEKCDEQHLVQRIIALSKDLSSFHLENCTIWRELLQASLETLSSEAPLQHRTDEERVSWKACRFGDTMSSVLEDLSGIEQFLQNIHGKLDSAAHTASDQPSQDLETMHSSRPDGLVHGPPQNQEDPVGLLQDSSSHGAPGSNLMSTPAVCCQPNANPRPVHNETTSQTSDADNRDVLDEVTPDMGAGDEAVTDITSLEEDVPGAGVTDEGTEAGVSGGDRGQQSRGERSDDLVTRTLSGQSASGTSKDPNLCYVTAPGVIGQLVMCEEVNSASSRVVREAEELVSRVLRIQTLKPLRAPSPVTIAIPFTSRHRGSYRDILVKVFDKDERSSYITPTSIEGVYGGKRGSFAEVKVYKLGLFAVVSCLRRESFTVPRKGLSLKLSMDSRICFDYFPGTFSSPVVVQSMIQPVDGSLLSMLRGRSDAYLGVLSSSSLVYLTHPSTVRFRRPLTLTLPCPPNPERKKAGEEPDRARPATTATMATRPTHRVRSSSAAVKSSTETGNELLVLLGYKEEQWMVMEDITVRNMQNGLVSFELTDNLRRLIVLRLASSLRPGHLTSLVEAVEGSVHSSRVTIVLHHQAEQPHAVVVALVPSKDLSWELAKLQKEGYRGPPDPSGDITMREGEQLQLSFRGNIISTGDSATEVITFHNQRKNRLFLQLTEVDEFGNHSSPHYKGTAIFHRISRDQRISSGDTLITSPDTSPQNPVCKLSLTLPKKVRSVSRPVSAMVMSSEQSVSDPLSDELLRWLSEELGEDDAALLVLCLRVSRSAIQLVKLQVPDHLPQQVYHLLMVWRRGLPTSADKTGLLSRYLCKSGRPDLAKELLEQSCSPVNT